VNRPIRAMAVFCMLLFLALLVNATYVQYMRADALNSHDGNRRVIDAQFSRERGPILVGRDPVAESRPVDDRYQFQRV
jgi:peptidoglycan glycosyltransferase